jgi:hypothetical protein
VHFVNEVCDPGVFVFGYGTTSTGRRFRSEFRSGNAAIHIGDVQLSGAT